MVENVRQSDVPVVGEVTPAREVPDPTSAPDGSGLQADEHAAMRQTVAREYADALGKRYEPPSEESEPERPRFDKVEIGQRQISDYVTAAGLTARDAGLLETQIRDGVKNGTPVVGGSDQHGQRWSVDVPVSGPAGTTTVRTDWIMVAGSDQPRLAAISPSR
jgi:hypothetical protein